MVVVNVGLLEVGDFGIVPSSRGLSCSVPQFGCSVGMDVISELMGCDGIVAKMKVAIPEKLHPLQHIKTKKNSSLGFILFRFNMERMTG
jgi:hypothetical protein